MTHNQATLKGWTHIGSTIYTKMVDGLPVYERLSSIDKKKRI
jgi:hypothetical protein